MTPPTPAAVHPASAAGVGGAPQTRPTPGPRLADGTELLGRYRGSGHAQAPHLIRRADGRMVEVSPLLEMVAAGLDGRRQVAEVAAEVSRELGRPFSADNVEYLVERKLRPLGVVSAETRPPVPATATDPLLGLSLRLGAIPPRVVRAAAAVLGPLFAPVVVVSLLAAVVALDVWLVQAHRVGALVSKVVSTPGLLVVVVALTLVAGAFHELGHATASRYGGADPGVIGAGIYLMWPVFYNDLNDSYRLSRTGRLRADLGGVYFNAVFVLLLFGAYGLTGAETLLAAIAVQHLVVLQQFLPFVRLDGYYVVSDMAGVPDLFGHVRPVLSGLVPGRAQAASVAALRPRARLAVTAWVLVTVPLLAALLVLFVLGLPGLAAAIGESTALQMTALSAAVRSGDRSVAVLSGLQLAFLVVPVVGLGVPLVRALRGVTRRLQRGLHRRQRRCSATPLEGMDLANAPSPGIPDPTIGGAEAPVVVEVAGQNDDPPIEDIGGTGRRLHGRSTASFALRLSARCVAALAGQVVRRHRIALGSALRRLLSGPHRL